MREITPLRSTAHVRHHSTLPCLLLALVFTRALPAQSGFASRWEGEPDAIWLGPQHWANRLQDFELRAGRVECTHAALPMRTLHLTQWRSEHAKGGLTVTVRVGRAPEAKPDVLSAENATLPPTAFVGLLVGAGAADLDPRAACLVQSAPGPDGGYLLGIDGTGRLFLRANVADEGRAETHAQLAGAAAAIRDVVLELRATNGPRDSKLEGVALDAARTVLATVRLDKVPTQQLFGNLALVSHRGDAPKDDARFWFADWRANGPMLQHRPDLGVGPILASFHTLSRGVLKLSAVMMPCTGKAPGEVVLELERGGAWHEAARAPFAGPDYTAVFRVPGWQGDTRVPYRLRWHGRVPGDKERDHVYLGAIRPEPTGRPLRLAAFSCVHQVRHGFGKPGYPWNQQSLWYPHADLAERIEQQDPDLLFFAGDQIYEGASPTQPSRGEDAGLDYLYKWYLFCLSFRGAASERPTIVIPDDHDVYQGNLWGAGGRAAKRDNEGGYVMPADWVRMVERTQTSHLPDPVDPAPVEQSIGVYFTSLRYGRIDFAILEDRKWKSGPKGLVEHDGPRPDHITDPAFDMRRADVPGAVLLGDRQQHFLDRWARDWDGVAMKAVLSQSVFANVATHHGPEQDFLIADMDSNGWPHAGRNRALAAIRKAFAPMIAGDQHLATLVHHGIDAFDDAGWSFCVPAMANFYPRSWRPAEVGVNHVEGMPAYTGGYVDGFGNRITVVAATNIDGSHGREPLALHDGNPGYGIVAFDQKARTIRFECWPRYAKPGTDAQYAGWPVTVEQQDNYGKRATLRLPKLQITGCDEPVVMVEDAAGELLYAIRLADGRFWPPVFAPGRYRVTIGDGSGSAEHQRVLELEPTSDLDATVEVVLQ